MLEQQVQAPEQAPEWIAAAATLDEAIARLRRQLDAAASDLRLARTCYATLVDGRRTLEPSAWRSGLTAQELRVATLVACGMSNIDVAATLRLSVHTVKTHVRSVLEKLGARSRWQLPAMLPDVQPERVP
jgi:DNA-binding NarL/FixJ family response regulator